MRRLRVLLRRHPLLGLLPTCFGLAVAWVAIAQSHPPGPVEIEDIYDLEEWFRGQQEMFLPIMPPSDDPFMQTGYPKVLPFDPTDFPEECKGGLVGEIEYGVPVYDLYLVEDPTTREFVIYNADYDEVCALAAPTGYDAQAFVKEKYPDLYAGGYSAGQIAWLVDLYDPARIQISVRLVPEQFFDTYLEAVQTAASLASMSFGGMSMMSCSTTNYTGLWVCATTSNMPSNEIEITVHVPSGFSTNVDVYAVDTSDFNGTASVWSVIATNLATNVAAAVIWTNTPIDDADVRFFTAGSCYDGDGDEVPDATEILIFKSSVTNYDTDGDGFVDGEDGKVSTNEYAEGLDIDGDGYVDGELSNRTDPTNDDTNAPTVTITWPTNGYEEVWIP